MTKITIEIKRINGNIDDPVTKRDLDESIDAVKRAIERKSLSNDFQLLIGVKSILDGVQNQLPE